MAKTKKATAINATKELRKIRAEKEMLVKRESELKKVIEAYLLTAPNETLDTVECSVKLRHSVKFKVSNISEAESIAKLLKLDCFKLEGTKFANGLKAIDKNTDLSLYGKFADELAVLLTYRKN